MANLLSNACKFSPANKQAVIEVKNYGEGIPKEFHGKLFDKFTQADSSNTRKQNETGLGLFVVKKIIETHNGEVSFETGTGVETSLFVKLPIES